MEKLQFISQENAITTHIQSIQKACESGVKWIQLRVKDKTEDEILSLAKQAKEICDKYKAVLIINDYPHIAKKISAAGVHLGKEDMTVDEGRNLLGKNFIIGGTANTFEDIETHFKNGADYVGIGPFRFTTTKKKLSPILGTEGYKKIVSDCKQKGITIPLIAIGGIELNDIPDILQTGVNGIAVSGLIVNAENTKSTVSKINELLNQLKVKAC